MKKVIFIFILICFILPVFSARADGLGDRLRGRILLQVQEAGEAWYVNPVDQERYFLGRPHDAFALMRSLGLGISNRDIAKIGLPGKISADENLARRLSGRILLQVEESGEAYYVNPIDYKRYFLGRPHDAFALMRSKGLGITNNDLDQVAISATSLSAVHKPKVELFIMSLCPYGLQMQKGILPVAKLLEDKIEFEVKFVNYIMHGQAEISENLNQYCLQKTIQDKYLDYLACYVSSGESAFCQEITGIDSGVLNICLNETDEKYLITANYNNKESWLSGRYPKFSIHNNEVEKYDVKGSPTLVVDGERARSTLTRDPASLLGHICSYFDDPPTECQEELSSVSPAAGFGYSGSSAAGTCN